jgi:gliding motility-associated-like protein
MTEDGIYNVDLSQPIPTPVLNTITLPAGAAGLAVSTNLNAASPALTFYTVVNEMYQYYDGNSWVNTNHSAGPGVNIGGGGGYIYNYSFDGVTRYDGTGDAISIATLSGLGSVADLAVDCSGNFYHLHNDIPQKLTKYSSSGVVLKVYAVTGAPIFTGGGGLVVFGNDVYYDDLSSSLTFPPLLHGTINGDTIDFEPSGFTIKFAQDMASCPGNLVSTAPINVSICSNQLPFNWNGQNYNAAGTYTATFISASGCDSIVTLNLSVNNDITNTVNTTVCSSQLPYNWNGQNYNAAGTYTATFISASGCDSIITLNLSVNNVITNTVNITVCSSQLPYNWNGQNYNATGTYTQTFASTDGCDSIVTLNLDVSQSPAMPSVSSPVNLCQFQTTQPLSATTTGNLIWYTSASGGIGSSTAPVPSTTNAGVTNFYVSQSIAGCESPRATIKVNVLEAIALGSDKTITICNGDSMNLTSLYNTAGSAANWFLNLVLVTDPTSVSLAGTYQLIATKSSGCADTAFVNLVIQPAVIAFAGNDDSTESFVPYQLSGSGGLQYEWSPGPPLLNNANIRNPIAILTDNTTFSLIVKDAIGCKGYDTVTIKTFKGTDIFVPSAFTPNRDGLNDIFRPLGSAIERLDYFRIYNRYGDLIFETNNLSKGWDGTYKGKDQKTDNYVWVLKALDRKKVIRTMKGNVILIR